MRQFYRGYGYGERQGIKAVSRRGDFGTGWLARAWCKLLDDLGPYSAATKGRSVARGQYVQTILTQPGAIVGHVIDYSMLFRTEIHLAPLSDALWERIIRDIQADPLLTAQILGGQLPPTIIPIFERTRHAIIPKGLDAFTFACGCYNWEEPCKHAAGVLYLVGEELDRDPLLIFTLRGMPVYELLPRLNQAAPATELVTPIALAPPEEPLSADPVTFWQGHMPPHAAIAAAAAHSAMPLPLQPFPFWAGSQSFAEAITAYRANAASQVLKLQNPPTEAEPRES
jgi:uncharacterized Zn finger protein